MNDSAWTWLFIFVGVVLIAFMLVVAHQSDVAREEWVNKCFSEGKLAARLAISDEWICVEIKQEQ